MSVSFFRCAQCGNVAIKPFDSGAPLSCCGSQMEELVANSTDAAVEKHVPAPTVAGNAVHVEVGSVEHPMTPEHLITLVCLETERGYQIAELTADNLPVADFRMAESDTPLKVYEYCNLHGLWEADLA